ncbi:hypothetical protein NUW58_g5711 [Xylaria curta]|uniref:Uncharacterized protein n=1 Tax=Xylaria curta TaxID=42375 RepID=A0ACC1P135_9PEZI|nr:hypothetical protein NUW58_g5711 [Xylaria curta]
MQDDVNSSKKPSSILNLISPPEHVSIIRSACERDIKAIVEVERISFPQVYMNVCDLVDRRRRELAGGYPCYKVLAAITGLGEASAIHGLIIFESYLRFSREYYDPKSGEEITLPANRPPDKKPAYSILMAAVRADAALLKDEFLFVSEICIHPCMRERGNGTRLMGHIVEMANVLAVKIIVLVEGSISEAAQRWMTDEAEEVNTMELAALREMEQRTMMRFYEDKLGFRKRAYFFWGRRGTSIPRIFHVMQYTPHP